MRLLNVLVVVLIFLFVFIVANVLVPVLYDMGYCSTQHRIDGKSCDTLPMPIPLWPR